MSRKRQLEKKEETKQLILDTAASIVEAEGIEKLSIRSITRKLDYSPGIIYHYFKDKDEILETLLKRGYQKIVETLIYNSINADNPEDEIREGFNQYIATILQYGNEYKSFVLSERPNILDKTRILYEGVCDERESMKQLSSVLTRGVDEGIFDIDDVELTAQALWVSVNGLGLRLIIEDVGTCTSQVLIDRQLDILIKGIKK